MNRTNHFLAPALLAAAGLTLALSTVPAQAASVPVTDGLKLWLDATDASTLFTDAGKTTTVTTLGDTVKAWADKSGEGNDALESSLTGNNNPTNPIYATNAIGGNAAVRFGGGNEGLDITSGLGINAGQERTIFLVLNYDNASDSNNEVFGTSTQAMINPGRVNNGLGLRDADNDNVVTSASNVSPAQTDLIVSVRAFASGTTRTLAESNGVEVINTSGIHQHFDMTVPVGIGWALRTFDNRSYDGDLSEVLVFDRALDANEMNQVGVFLQDKYSIDGAFIPEPASVALVGLGGVILLTRRRRA